MPTIQLNDVELYYEVRGSSGPPLVLVHGSWADHASWIAVADRLAAEFRVYCYDRRGYTRSERPAGGWTRRDSEDDLAAVIETLAGAPAYVVGTSFGGLITLGLASRRPDLLQGFAVHEPPAMSVGRGELLRLMAKATASVDTVLAEIQAGTVERAAQRFMEDVALGPGAWDLLPEDLQATFIGNAPAVATELRQSDWSDLDIAALNRCGHRPLFTKGDAAPIWLQRTLDGLAELVPQATKATIAGAGHAPHVSHPDEYAALLAGFFVSPEALAA